MTDAPAELDGPDEDEIIVDEPNDETTSPYEGKPLEDGVGFHDIEAAELDQLPEDAGDDEETQ